MYIRIPCFQSFFAKDSSQVHYRVVQMVFVRYGDFVATMLDEPSSAYQASNRKMIERHLDCSATSRWRSGNCATCW